MKKIIIIIFVALLLVTADCISEQAPKSTYTQSKIYQIVHETLTQAELTNKRLLETMDNNVLEASLISWQHQPLAIIKNEPDNITVMLQGEFMLTAKQANLPLTLTCKSGR